MTNIESTWTRKCFSSETYCLPILHLKYDFICSFEFVILRVCIKVLLYTARHKKVKKNCRKLHNKEPKNANFSPDTLSMADCAIYVPSDTLNNASLFVKAPKEKVYNCTTVTTHGTYNSKYVKLCLLSEKKKASHSLLSTGRRSTVPCVGLFPSIMNSCLPPAPTTSALQSHCSGWDDEQTCMKLPIGR